MGNRIHKAPSRHLSPDPSENPLKIQKETPAGFETWIGAAGARGRRPSMEDAIAVKEKDGLVFMGVFDGHGGDDTSSTLSKTFPDLVLDKYPLKDLFKKRQAYLVKKVRQMDQTLFHFWDGSTAAFGIFSGELGRLDVGNLGDSRVLVVYEDGKVKATKDHKPGDKAEMARIAKAGGTTECVFRIRKRGDEMEKMCRVNGNLAVSRAFGDFQWSSGLKSKLPGQDSKTYAVSDVPEIYQFPLKNARYIVLACDGLWDVLTNEKVAKFLQANTIKSPYDLATDLVTQAYNKGSTDNISVIVIDLSKTPLDLIHRNNDKKNNSKIKNSAKKRQRSRSIGGTKEIPN